VNALACLDGRVLPADEATVPVLDRGFLYGDAVFEVLRVVGGRPVDLTWHLERMSRAAGVLGIAPPPPATWKSDLTALLLGRGVGDAHLRLLLSRGVDEGGGGVAPPAGARPTRLVVLRPLDVAQVAALDRPVHAAIVSRQRPGPSALDPGIKTANYLPSVLAQAEARARGADEALLTGDGGEVLEGATSSLFLVRAGRGPRVDLVTPPLAAGILDGVTRRRVIALAATAGVPVIEERLRPEAVRAADEIFLTSSVRGVVPVVKLDGVAVGDGSPGPATRALRGRYAGFLADVARGTGAL
jgi:branched-chain amino acid aminotransferase